MKFDAWLAPHFIHVLELCFLWLTHTNTHFLPPILKWRIEGGICQKWSAEGAMKWWVEIQSFCYMAVSLRLPCLLLKNFFYYLLQTETKDCRVKGKLSIIKHKKEHQKSVVFCRNPCGIISQWTIFEIFCIEICLSVEANIYTIY